LRTPEQILVPRSGRHRDPDLQEQLIGDAFLAPRGILIPDPANERLELRGNRRSAGTGLQPPEQFPSRSAPALAEIIEHDLLGRAPERRLSLYSFRDGDANMRSVWLFSRNDAIGNFAVMLAA
jgi:Co/Zn/Cd efflux system component